MSDLDAQLGRITKKNKREAKIADAGRTRQVATSSSSRSRQSKKPEKGEKQDLGSRWKYLVLLALILGGGLQVVLPLVDQIWSMFAPSYVRLSVDRPQELQDVFFSGQPWLVMCVNDTAPAPPIARTTAEHAGSKFRVGLLDCTRKLPSGLSTLDRFRLQPVESAADKEKRERMEREAAEREKQRQEYKARQKAQGVDTDKMDREEEKAKKQQQSQQPQKTETPIAFYVANGGKPTPVSMAYYNHESHGSKLAEMISKQVAPRLRKIGAQQHLQSLFNRKHSALILHHGKLSEEHQALVHELSHSQRNIAFATFDSKRYQLSIEKALPAAVADAPVLVYFKRVKNETQGEESSSETTKASKAAQTAVSLAAKSHRGSFDSRSLSSFLSSVMDTSKTAGSESLASLKRAPTMKIRSVGTTSSKKKTTTPEPNVKRRATPIVDDDSRTYDETLDAMYESDAEEDTAGKSASSSSSSSSSASSSSAAERQAEAKKANRAAQRAAARKPHAAKQAQASKSAEAKASKPSTAPKESTTTTTEEPKVSQAERERLRREEMLRQEAENAPRARASSHPHSHEEDEEDEEIDLDAEEAMLEDEGEDDLPTQIPPARRAYAPDDLDRDEPADEDHYV